MHTNTPFPVIIVPGITATCLKDEYPLPPEFVWKVLSKDYGRASLHPNNLKYEATEPARVRPAEIFGVAYQELIEELRYNLRQKEDEPVPVYPFSYDWRMPLETSVDRLDSFIDEVIDRTRLLRNYHAAGYTDNPKVNLVGHSMGGLVVTGYMEKKRDRAPVHKVATLATPYRGSFEAVIKIATGTANLGVSAPSSREREMARITPALYYLLPSFNNGMTAEPGIPDSLFDPGAWQHEVTDTISEFIRLKGLPTATPREDAGRLFAGMLGAAKSFIDRINALSLEKMAMEPDRWLTVVGVDATTRVRLAIKNRNNAPYFQLSSEDRKNAWSDVNNPHLRRLTGDGTVPFEGAVPPFLREENIVCVTPDDYGYWEIQDKGLTNIAGFHGVLPNMNMIHRLLVRFFTGRPDPKKNTWGRRAPGVAHWRPPLDLREEPVKETNPVTVPTVGGRPV